MDKLITLTPSH